jgi:hypothetical protein
MRRFSYLAAVTVFAALTSVSSQAEIAHGFDIQLRLPTGEFAIRTFQSLQTNAQTSTQTPIQSHTRLRLRTDM